MLAAIYRGDARPTARSGGAGGDARRSSPSLSLARTRSGGAGAATLGVALPACSGGGDAWPSPRLRRWRRCVGDAEQLAVALPTPPAQRRRRRSAQLTPAAPTATRRLPARPPRPAPAALHGAGSNARRVSSPVLPPVLPSVCAAPCLSCHLYCSASCSALCLCCPLLLCSVSCFSGYCVVGCIQDTRAAALLSPAPWLAAPAPAVPGTDDLVGCDGCRRPCITSPVAGGARPGCPRN